MTRALIIVLLAAVSVGAPAYSYNHFLSVWGGYDCSPSSKEEGTNVGSDSTSSLSFSFSSTCKGYEYSGDLTGVVVTGPGPRIPGESATLVLTNFQVIRTSAVIDGGPHVKGTLVITHITPAIPSPEASASYEGYYGNRNGVIIYADSTLKVIEAPGPNPFLQMKPLLASSVKSPKPFSVSDGPKTLAHSLQTVWVNLEFELGQVDDGVFLPDSATLQIVAGASEVPVLSPFGVVVIGLLLAGMGLALLQTRGG